MTELRATEVDVAVIGAGAAGLAAGGHLVSAGKSVVVLEARERVGGRARTVATPAGFPVDLGCGWLHSADRNPFVPIARRLGFSIDEALWAATAGAARSLGLAGTVGSLGPGHAADLVDWDAHHEGDFALRLGDVAPTMRWFAGSADPITPPRGPGDPGWPRGRASNPRVRASDPRGRASDPRGRASDPRLSPAPTG